MCAWIVWIQSLSPSNHPRSDHAPIVIVIQSEHLKHSIPLRNQSAKHPDSGCFGISGVVIGSTGAIKGMALWSRGFSRGSLFKTWPKPETAHEKSLAPRVVLDLMNTFISMDGNSTCYILLPNAIICKLEVLHDPVPSFVSRSLPYCQVVGL